MTRAFSTLMLVEGGRAWEMSRVEPHVAIRLKAIFPRVPKQSTGPYRFLNDPFHCTELLWFLERYPAQISEEDRSALAAGRRRYDAGQRELESILLPDWQPPAYLGLKPGCAVRPYQAQVAEVFRRRKALLVADQVGLGKTYEAAVCCLVPGALPAAVVVQAHLQRQWTEKLTAFKTLSCYQIKRASVYDIPPADVYIFRYGQLLGWTDVFAEAPFATVVYDEIQELRTAGRNRPRAGPPRCCPGMPSTGSG